MRLQDTMPTEGQFVALWMNNGLLWSDTHRYQNGVLQQLESNGKWVLAAPHRFYEAKSAKFAVED